MRWFESLHASLTLDVTISDGLMQPRSLSNSAPYLLISRSSAAYLASIVGRSVDEIMKRFRANFIIDGLPPFCEDQIKELTIGDVHFEVNTMLYGVSKNFRLALGYHAQWSSWNWNFTEYFLHMEVASFSLLNIRILFLAFFGMNNLTAVTNLGFLHVSPMAFFAHFC